MRRIKKARPQFISLVPRGANRLPVLYKDGDLVEFDALVKADMDQGLLTAVVYAPEHRDSQGDIASAEVIRDMAYAFAKEGKGVDIRHNGEVLPKSAAYVAESFIIQSGDTRFAKMAGYDGQPVDVTGGWAVTIKVDDPELRTAYREGRWNGVSFAGPGQVEIEKSDDTEPLVRFLKQLFGFGKSSTNPSGDTEMNAEDLKKELGTFKTEMVNIVKETVTTLTKAHTDAALEKSAGVLPDDKPEVKLAKTAYFTAFGKAMTASGGIPAAPAAGKPEKPVFKGDLAKSEDVANFEVEVKKWEITSAMDPSDPASVKAANVKLAELVQSSEPQSEEALAKAAGIEPGDSEQVRSLKLDNFNLKKQSNQPVSKAEAPGAFTVGISKEDREAATIGQRMASFANGERPKSAAA